MAVAVPMPPPSPSSPPTSPPPPDGAGAGAAWRASPAWVDRFHQGDRRALEECYRQYFPAVERAARGILNPDDAETVVHEVFSRLIANRDLRCSFRGGAFTAWIATVSRNLAIDYRRRLGREVSLSTSDEEDEGASAAASAAGSRWEDAAEARMLVERFRREHLDPKWDGVFEMRFLQQLPQREAAQRLGINRTTLAYREVMIRRALKRFLIDEPPHQGNEP